MKQRVENLSFLGWWGEISNSCNLEGKRLSLKDLPSSFGMWIPCSRFSALELESPSSQCSKYDIKEFKKPFY